MKFIPNIHKQIHLSTPTGDVILIADIVYHSKNILVTDENAESMSIKIIFNEREYIGIGTEYPWMDAFTNLQKQLPENVNIKGCINCRYGNMCPVGNAPFEVFCTKDLIITQKEDLFFYTEDITESKNRSREYTGLCESYEKQSKSYYTYTNYNLNKT